MPYSEIQNLPDQVTDNLPKHAQEIYKEAYNSAWQEYKKEEDRRDNTTREEVSHRVAWAAVKQTYEKQDGTWKKKNNG